MRRVRETDRSRHSAESGVTELDQVIHGRLNHGGLVRPQHRMPPRVLRVGQHEDREPQFIDQAKPWVVVHEDVHEQHRSHLAALVPAMICIELGFHVGHDLQQERLVLSVQSVLDTRHEVVVEGLDAESADRTTQDQPDGAAVPPFSKPIGAVSHAQQYYAFRRNDGRLRSA